MSICRSASVIINGHREGNLLARTLKSAVAAKAYALSLGFKININLVLDNPDKQTKAVAEKFTEHLAAVYQVAYRNLGDSRQHGVKHAKDDWLFFLDGDDLVSENWFGDAILHVNSDRNRKKTVYHTELFVGFDAEIFYRRAMKTTDPEFDPYGLICDWFFCNNLFVHRSILKDCPIQPYDHAAGYGAEDWHWSCEATARGIARDFIPQTTYFYRIKPAELSLGMTTGLIHKASDLFSLEFLQQYKSKSNPATVMRMESKADPILGRFRNSVPDWLFAQAEQTASIDSKVIETARFALNNPSLANTFPPRLHYGAAQFYRSIIDQFTGGTKVGLWWGSNETAKGAAHLPAVINLIRSQYKRPTQIVVISELDPFTNKRMQTLYNADDVAIIDAGDALSNLDIPQHYLAAVLIRLFIQFNFRATVNVSSKLLPIVAETYPKALKTEAPNTLHVSLAQHLDGANKDLSLLFENLAAFQLQKNTALVADTSIEKKLKSVTTFPIEIYNDSEFRSYLVSQGETGALKLSSDTTVFNFDKAEDKKRHKGTKTYKNTIYLLYNGGESQILELKRSLIEAPLGSVKFVILLPQSRVSKLPFATVPSRRFKGGQFFKAPSHPNFSIIGFTQPSAGSVVNYLNKLKGTRPLLIANAATMFSTEFLKAAFSRSNSARKGGMISEYNFSPRGPVWDLCHRRPALQSSKPISLLTESELPFGSISIDRDLLQSVPSHTLNETVFHPDLFILSLITHAHNLKSLDVFPNTVTHMLSTQPISMEARVSALRILDATSEMAAE